MLLILLAQGCREGEEADSFVPIPPSFSAAHGCQDLAGDPAAPVGIDLDGMGLPLGTSSRMVASLGLGGTPVLFVSGPDASIYRIEIDSMGMVTGSVWVSPGTVAALAAYASVSAAPELSGLAILPGPEGPPGIFPPGLLVAAEHAGNTLLLASATVADDVFVAPGLQVDEGGGNSDGTASQIRFNLTEPVHLVSSGSTDVYLPDPGNHSVRLVRLDGLASSATVMGTGAAGFADGALGVGQLDTPTGISLACDGTLWLSELGSAAAGGHRLRALRLGVGVFGGLEGTLSTAAGDGSAATVEGVGELASLWAPDGACAVRSSGGAEQVFWVDSASGVLRRYDVTTGLVDCPLDPACVPGGLFSASGSFSLAVLGDVLYVLDAGAGMLFRVTF